MGSWWITGRKQTNFQTRQAYGSVVSCGKEGSRPSNEVTALLDVSGKEEKVVGAACKEDIGVDPTSRHKRDKRPPATRGVKKGVGGKDGGRWRMGCRGIVGYGWAEMDSSSISLTGRYLIRWFHNPSGICFILNLNLEDY